MTPLGGRRARDPAQLLALTHAIALVLAVAQTSERLPRASVGTSAGSPAVVREFVVDHATAYSGAWYYDTATATMRPFTKLTAEGLHRARTECQAWHDLALPGPSLC